MDLQAKIKEFLIKHRMLRHGRGVLVAVSGGPDSVAMLYLLHDLREELELNLEVAHLQHGIRGEEAKKDARFVAGLADRLGLPCHLKELDLPQLKLKAGKGNLEEMGRLERYRYFAATAHRRQLDAVATAHTVNDQAETMVMRLFRGSGRKGLGGMEPVRQLDDTPDNSFANVLLIRPFLSVTREEVMVFLGERNIPYRVDSTNSDLFYLRNWIRLKLMPQVREKFGAELSARLSDQAEVLRDEESYLTDLSRTLLERISKGGDLSRMLLLDLSKALQRRVIRLWIEHRRGHLRGIDFDHAEAALSLIAAGPPHGRLALPGGWELAREYDTVKLQRVSRNVKPQCYSYPLQAGSNLIIVEAGMTIASELVRAAPAKLPENLMEVAFDADLITENLLVRNFRRGDRFQPLGMTGHKKVKDLFIERKLPLRLRAATPLLAMGTEILWIPGHGRSEVAKIGPATTIALRLKAAWSD